MKRLMNSVFTEAGSNPKQADARTSRKMRGGTALRSTMVLNKWGGELDLEICENIGEGSYGVVNRAIDKHTGQSRVIKRVVQPERWDENSLKAEAELLQRFDHPHIVRIFAWCVKPGAIEIVMEHCTGGEYLAVVRKGKKRGESLNEQWVASAFSQVFEALAYVHAKGIVHRDLKSGNLLLLEDTESETGSVFEKLPHMVICDLGIATVYAEGFWSKCMDKSDVAGTPAFMAPEIWSGKNAGPKCDIWSMGVLLFQTYANRLPFNLLGCDSNSIADSQDAWLACIRKGADWTRMRATPMVKEFCEKLLAFKESARPTAVECIRDQWISTHANKAPTAEEIQGVMEALSFWKDKNPWQRAICLKLAVGCTCANRFARIFGMFDRDCSGVLSHAEVLKTLLELGIEKQDANKIANHLDFNRDKTCEFLEFVAACLCSLKEEFDQMLRSLFAMLDTNDDGVIDESEIRLLASELEPIAMAHGFVLGDLDQDQDGVISFREFAAYFGRPGIRRSSIDSKNRPLMRFSVCLAKDVLARRRSVEEVKDLLKRAIVDDSSCDSDTSSVPPTKVADPRKTKQRSRARRAPQSRRKPKPQFDFENDALSSRILETLQRHKVKTQDKKESGCKHKLYSASDTESETPTSCAESYDCEGVSSVEFSDFDFTGYDCVRRSNSSASDEFYPRIVSLGDDILPRFVSL